MRALVAVLIAYLLIVFLRAFIAEGIPAWGFDENVYLTAARELFQSGAQHTLYHSLYPYLLQRTFAAPENFLALVRVINAFLISSAMLPVFALGLRIVPPYYAAAVSVVTGLLGENTISAHAMTENLMLPLFCVSLWATYEAGRAFASESRSPISAISIGVWLGSSIALFVHATPKYIPLIIGVVVAFGFSAICSCRWLPEQRRRNTLARHFLGLVAALIAGAAVFLLLNRVLLGDFVPTFRDFYERIRGALELGNVRTALASHSIMAIDMVVGHVAILGVFLGTAYCLAALAFGLAWRKKHIPLITAFAFVIVTTTLLLAQTLYFTVAIGAGTPIVARTLFERYYYFSFPAILIAAAWYISSKTERNGGRILIPCAAILWTIAAWYTFYSGRSSVLNYAGIENADNWYSNYPVTYIGAVASAAVVAATFLVMRLRGIAPCLLLCHLVGYSLFATASQAYDLMYARGGDGRTAAYYLARSMTVPGDRIVIVTASAQIAEQSRVWSPWNMNWAIRLEPGNVITLPMLPKDATHAIVTEDVGLSPELRHFVVARNAGCSLLLLPKH